MAGSPNNLHSTAYFLKDTASPVPCKHAVQLAANVAGTCLLSVHVACMESTIQDQLGV